MQIQRWLLSPAQFAAIPVAERSFFVLLAHIQNEINVLNKLLACSTRTEPGLNANVQSGNCQSFILCRTLIGKLNEAWGAIQDGFFHSKLSISYESLLHEPAASALAQLKSYFGKKNLIVSVRNNFSFHYSRGTSPPVKPYSYSSSMTFVWVDRSAGGVEERERGTDCFSRDGLVARGVWPWRADPDANRSARLHSNLVVLDDSSHQGLVELARCRSDLSLASSGSLPAA